MVVDLGLALTAWACFIAGVIFYIKGFWRHCTATLGTSSALGVVEGVRSVIQGQSPAILAVGAVVGVIVGSVAFYVATYLRQRRERTSGDRDI